MSNLKKRNSKTNPAVKLCHISYSTFPEVLITFIMSHDRRKKAEKLTSFPAVAYKNVNSPLSYPTAL